VSIINTPSQMLADANALQAEFQRVASDVAGASVSADFKAQFLMFADDWGAYFATISDGVSGYVDRLWGGTQEKIDGYRSQLHDWQAKLPAGAVTGPAVAEPVQNDLGLGAGLSEVKWILIGVALIYGIHLYGKARG
jgi:hypothetical protein